MAARIKLDRGQLYSAASLASFGESTEMVFSLDLWNEDSGSVIVAVKVRSNAPKQRLKDTHDNGWAYYRIDRGGSGRVTPLTEKELEECL
jgi:hypothetical protein